MMPRRAQVLGIGVDAIRRSDAVDLVCSWLMGEDQKYIVSLNAEIVMQARSDRDLKDLILGADLALPDGQSVVNAMHARGYNEIERVPGRALFLDLCRVLATRKGRVFLLGGAPGVAEAAAGQLAQHYTGLEIAGTYAGQRGGEGDEVGRAEILKAAGGRPIDLLVIAYGAPHQEKWIGRNLAHLPEVRVAMVVGGTLDVISGKLRPPPKWVEDKGIEYLYRLYQQPFRFVRMLRIPWFWCLSRIELWRNHAHRD